MKSIRKLLICLIAVALGCQSTLLAQVAQENDTRINLADEADLDLIALVKVLATKKGLRITANSEQFPGTRNTKIIFFGEVKVDDDSLLEVVQSILRSNGFAIVQSDVKEMLQVVPLGEVRPFAPLLVDNEVGDNDPGAYVTGVFPLQHAKEQDVLEYLNKFFYLGKPDQTANNISSISGRNTLVITETVKRLVRIKALIEKLDVPATKQLREFYKVQHLQAEELKQQLNEILGLAASKPVTGQTTAQMGILKIDAILRTNQLLLTGSRASINDALELIEQLDVENQLTIETYQFQYTSAKQIDELVRGSLKGLEDERLDRIYQSDINDQSNRLIATTRPEIHARIKALKDQLDISKSLDNRKSPMKFYTLKNVKAIEMLETLQAIERRVNSRPANSDLSRPNNGITTIGDDNSVNINGISSPFAGQDNRFGLGSTIDETFGNPSQLTNQPFAFGTPSLSDFADFATNFSTAEKLIPGDAKVTVDENTNTLIVVAEPEIQQLYAELIKKLDVRRPQVLIEVTLVTITGQDDLDLGIEISGGDRQGDRRAFAFSRFNLSAVDAASGALSLAPALGFNGTLIDPGIADVVIRALSRHRRARVVTAPRILVNDNATGFLSSVAEVPFESNNIGNTVSTTSFGGFAQAGTIISVTPQISDDDYLNLEFDVQFNNFTQQPSGNFPPPRNTNQAKSAVSIPDGSTVVVGGLKRNRLSQDLIGIPFIENIPLLKRLSSRETNGGEDERLFVFIKPIILRDDKFRDLRFVSEVERQQACIPSDLPQSQPVLIR